MAEAADPAPTTITVQCKTEYPDYSFNEDHDIFALVSLEAPCQNEDEEKEEKVPMDIVAVMDKSGSMAGEKLELVKRTLEFVLTQLTENDKLALITYDSNVYSDFALMKMTSDNKKFATERIQRITDGSCTNLSGGLLRGLCEIIDRPAGQRNDVASVLLFTDGLANEGIQNVDGIVQAMQNPKKYAGPAAPPAHRDNPDQAAPHSSWLMNIFSKGSPRQSPTPTKKTIEEPSPPSASTSNEATVYTFGFGADHDAAMLKKISDAGNGMYYFVETEEKIGESFAHCLGGLASTVAQGIQLEIKAEEGVTIKEVHTTRHYEESAGRIKVNMGDLQSEEKRDVVLELTIEKVAAPHETTPQSLLQVEVDYFNVNTNNLDSVTGTLFSLRPETASARDVENVDAKVTKERSRIQMTNAIKEAGIRARRGSYGSAQDLLQEQIQEFKICHDNLRKNRTYDSSVEEGLNAMCDDLEDYCTATDEVNWASKGAHLEMNLEQAYNCQRSAAPDAKTFQSKQKKKAVKSFKLF